MAHTLPSPPLPFFLLLFLLSSSSFPPLFFLFSSSLPSCYVSWRETKKPLRDTIPTVYLLTNTLTDIDRLSTHCVFNSGVSDVGREQSECLGDLGTVQREMSPELSLSC
jgi:hypothetical protein